MKRERERERLSLSGIFDRDTVMLALAEISLTDSMRFFFFRFSSLSFIFYTNQVKDLFSPIFNVAYVKSTASVDKKKFRHELKFFIYNQKLSM